MPDAADRSGVERGRGEAFCSVSEPGGNPAQPRSESGVEAERDAAWWRSECEKAWTRTDRIVEQYAVLRGLAFSMIPLARQNDFRSREEILGLGHVLEDHFKDPPYA